VKTGVYSFNGQGLLLWRYLLMSSPEPLLNKVNDVDDKIYCLALFVTLELLPMPAHSRLLAHRPRHSSKPHVVRSPFVSTNVLIDIS
jgi:hypothetical protein